MTFSYKSFCLYFKKYSLKLRPCLFFIHCLELSKGSIYLCIRCNSLKLLLNFLCLLFFPNFWFQKIYHLQRNSTCIDIQNVCFKLNIPCFFFQNKPVWLYVNHLKIDPCAFHSNFLGYGRSEWNAISLVFCELGLGLNFFIEKI